MWRPVVALLLLSVAPATAQNGGAQNSGAPEFLARAEAAAAAAGPPPACVAARAEADGRVRHHALTTRVIGAAAGTTGGIGRRLIIVNSAADDAASEPGTLRWAVGTARQEGGGWIAFAPSLSGQVIHLRSGLRLPSDTTLDGGCGGVTLQAPAHTTILLIADATNIIVSGLTFSKTAYAEPDERIADAIGLRDGFDRVALLNNAFARCGDGCIDIVRRVPSPTLGRVTVAFNRIENHNKVMLIGALACNQPARPEACDRPLERLGDALRPTIRVSLVGNVFLGTSQRHPKAVASAFVHSVNNLIVLAPTRYSSGEESAVYGGAAASGGLLASEGDILVNPAGRARIGLGPVSAHRPTGAPARETDGAVWAEGTVAIGAVRVVRHMAELARAALAAEPVPARPRLAGSEPGGLAACLLRGAGPRGAALRWEEGCSPASVNLDTNLGQSARAAKPNSR